MALQRAYKMSKRVKKAAGIPPLHTSEDLPRGDVVLTLVPNSNEKNQGFVFRLDVFVLCLIFQSKCFRVNLEANSENVGLGFLVLFSLVR